MATNEPEQITAEELADHLNGVAKLYTQMSIPAFDWAEEAYRALQNGATRIRALQEALAEKDQRIRKVEQAFAEYRGISAYEEESAGKECPWRFGGGCGLDGDNGCQWTHFPERRKVGADVGCALQRSEFRIAKMAAQLTEARKRAVPECYHGRLARFGFRSLRLRPDGRWQGIVRISRCYGPMAESATEALALAHASEEVTHE